MSNITKQGLVKAPGQINENLFCNSYFSSNMPLGGSNDTSSYLGYYNGSTSIHNLVNGEDTITLTNTSNLGINFKRLATDINLDSNSYYTISCEAKCSNANAHLDIGLSYCNTSNSWVWRGGSNPQNFSAANTWQKFKLTFKPDANTKYIGYCFTVNCGDNHTLVLRRCKLEKGSIVTPWTPSPLDAIYTGSSCGFTELSIVSPAQASVNANFWVANEFIEW